MPKGPIPRTLYQKIWDDHAVSTEADGMSILWIDRHMIHEVTTPQAFEGLRAAGRTVHRPDLTLAVADHNVPTTARNLPNPDPQSALQLAALDDNCRQYNIERIAMEAPEQGIVHVVGPEQGFTLPGVTLVCGDSHTATHGALGALAFGIGTSEIEHVFATQTLNMRRSRTMEIQISGKLGPGIGPKDVALAIVRAIGTGGATGCVIEYTGSVIREMSIEGRMTICNMAIEAGARAGLVAPDGRTFEYVKGRPRAPTGDDWDRAVEYWRTLQTDVGAAFDHTVEIDGAHIEPLVTWGTSPEDVLPINDTVPSPMSFADHAKRAAAAKSLEYMDLAPGTRLDSIAIDHVFIGSCTNSRIEDLRAAAEVVKGRHIAKRVRQALVVPGSGLVRRQAEEEGLADTFRAAGFEWREPGCSMCLSMNADRVPSGERCASTSNRNFVGRQGPGARTHLMSPAMAAAAAIAGHLIDVREMVS